MKRRFVSRFRLFDRQVTDPPSPGQVFKAGSISIGCHSGGHVDVMSYNDQGQVGFKLTAWGSVDEKGTRRGTGGELGEDEARELRDWLSLHLAEVAR